MQCKPVAKTSLKTGDKTSLGTITAIEVSESGKTMKITVKTHSGSDFTDRVSTDGNMMVFTEA